jgi:hypothetical protein
MTSRPFALAAILCVLAVGARADSHTVMTDRMEVYAAFAGLDSTLSDAARAGLVGVFPGLSPDVRTAAAMRYAEAAAEMEARLAAMETMGLTGAAAEAAASIGTSWEVIGREGATLISQADAQGDTMLGAVARWAEGLDNLDDKIDLILEDIRTGRTIEG